MVGCLGNDDGGDEIDDDAGTDSRQSEEHGYESDNGGIDAKEFCDTTANTQKHLVSGAHELPFARAVCRRAERDVIALREHDEVLRPLPARYLNRLSDVIWLLARE